MNSTAIIVTVVAAVVAAAVFGVIGFLLGGAHRKKVAEAAIGSATEEAARIVNQAVQTAENKRKETILEAKDEAHRLITEAERNQGTPCGSTASGAAADSKRRIARQKSRDDGEKGRSFKSEAQRGGG